MADNNPWRAETWNVMAQMAYLRQFGQARAEARARDAGTTLGGRRPVLAPGVVPTGDGQTRYFIFNKIKEVAVAPPPSPFFLVASIQDNLGANMSAALTREVDLSPSPSMLFGFNVDVTLEVQLHIVETVGFDTTSLLELSRELVPAPMALGIGTAVVVTLIQENIFLTINPGIGFDAAAQLTVELDLVASAALGITTAAAVTREWDAVAAPALGASMAAAIQRDLPLGSAAPALGYSAAAALDINTLNLGQSEAIGLTQAVTMTLLFGSVTTFTQVGTTTTSTTAAIAYPSGIAAGDLALIFEYTVGTQSFVIPTGWLRDTAAAQTNVNGTQILFRVLNGTESGSVTCSTGSTGQNKAMIVLRGDNPWNAIHNFFGQSGGGVASSQAAITIAESSNGAVKPTVAAGIIGSSAGTTAATWSNNLTLSQVIGNAKVYVANDDTALADHLLRFSSAQSNGISGGFAASMQSNVTPPTISQANNVSGTDFARSTSATSLSISYTPTVSDSHVILITASKSASAFQSQTPSATGVTFTSIGTIQSLLAGNDYTLQVWSAPVAAASWGGVAKTISVSFGGTLVDCLIYAFTIQNGNLWSGSSKLNDGCFNASSAETVNVGGGTTPTAQHYTTGGPDLLLCTQLKTAVGAVSPAGFTPIVAVDSAGGTWEVKLSWHAVSALDFSNSASWTPSTEATAAQAYIMNALIGDDS